MTNLLLELFSEEIPARMQADALKQLSDGIIKELGIARLHYDSIKGYVTPRRIALWVSGLPDTQPNQVIERKGPKLSAPEAAINGFCASSGVDRDALQIQGEGKDATYYIRTEQKGLSAIVALNEIITSILREFHWPKSMRWGAFERAWVRPLRSIMCLFGEHVVPVTWEHLVADRITYGHRFMAPAPISLQSPDTYEAVLEEAYVIVDADKRRALIEQQATDITQAQGFSWLRDDSLLDEVTGLVEYPVALMGTFDVSYLSLPSEVLVLEMRHHQKYFAVYDAERQITNRFITISNLQARDGGAKIIAGNERVIRARLEDGAFYYEQDKKRSLDSWSENLESMMFHKRLGSMFDKVRRMLELVDYLMPFVSNADPVSVRQAVALCKADLTTGMVGEFPELQGVMGRYYALAEGADAHVCDAIRDHYKPVGMNDTVPTAPTSVVVALADKLDTLVGMFAASEIPTGSKDPYALRRAALGIIKILRIHEIRFKLKDMINNALIILYNSNSILLFEMALEADHIADMVQLFMMERFKVVLRDEGLSHDLVDAAFMQGADDDVMRIDRRAAGLQKFLNSEDGINVLAAYKRAANILKKEEAKDGIVYDGCFDHDIILREMEITQKPYERDLVQALANVYNPVTNAVSQENYEAAMQHLASLRIPLDDFFAHVIVNSPDALVRANRLHMLAHFRALLHSVANFSMLKG